MSESRKYRFYQAYFLVMAVEALTIWSAYLFPRLQPDTAPFFVFSFPYIIQTTVLFVIICSFGWLSIKSISDRDLLAKIDLFFKRISDHRLSLPILSWSIVCLILLSAAIALQVFYPVAGRLPHELQIGLKRIFPLIIWLLAVSIQTYVVLFFQDQKSVRYILKVLLISGLVTFFLVVYSYGAVQQLLYVNTDKTTTDQSAYMDYARKLVESNYTYIGDYNRMPIYPLLQSLFYRDGLSYKEFFLQGKYINFILSIILLAGLSIILFWQLNPLSALNLILITSFTVFIFKAGFFQAELLFYFLNFCLFWLMWRFLQRPSYLIAILVGVIAGLAHLTKASILPGLAIFLLFAGIQHGRFLISRLRSKTPGNFVWNHGRYLFSIPIVGLLFLITIFPYILTGKRVFGHYFYNVNSTFYIWYDSWDEARLGTRAHGDRVGWPDMPADEIPSMSKYLREHSPMQILMRFVVGAREVFDRVLGSYGYFKYVLIYLFLCLLAGILHRRRTLEMFTTNRALWLFLITYFVVYALLYFWYAPIVAGNRLILAQFIPLMFVLSYIIQELIGQSTFSFRGKSIGILTAINLMILLVVFSDIFFVLTDRIRNMYGGF